MVKHIVYGIYVYYILGYTYNYSNSSVGNDKGKFTSSAYYYYYYH